MVLEERLLGELGGGAGKTFASAISTMSRDAPRGVTRRTSPATSLSVAFSKVAPERLSSVTQPVRSALWSSASTIAT